MDWERSHSSGAFSTAEFQKRYNDQYTNITKHYMDLEWGHRQDIDGYLKEVNALNNFFCGMMSLNNMHVDYKNGSEESFLSQSEIVANQFQFFDNNMFIKGTRPAHEITHMSDYSNDAQSRMGDLTERQEGRMQRGIDIEPVKGAV